MVRNIQDYNQLSLFAGLIINDFSNATEVAQMNNKGSRSQLATDNGVTLKIQLHDSNPTAVAGQNSQNTNCTVQVPANNCVCSSQASKPVPAEHRATALLLLPLRVSWLLQM